MEFDEFAKVINFIQSREMMAQDLNKVFQEHKYQVDFMSGYGFVDDTAINIIISLLENIFDDGETGWIEYWMYELNYGASWAPGMIQVKGKDVKLSTIEDLWNLLMEMKYDAI